MPSPTKLGRSPDELNIISSVWVMANNDENNLITYKGIIHRLQLPSNYDIKGLVHTRGELFRPGVQQQILDEWKLEMHGGKHLPSWIRDEKDKNKQNEMINAMTTADVFRSQFRVEKKAPKTDLSVIDWGLEHIERLRKSQLDSMDSQQKNIQLVILIITSLLNFLLALMNAIILATASKCTP